MAWTYKSIYRDLSVNRGSLDRLSAPVALHDVIISSN